MTKTYVIADLHGRIDLLEMALAKIEQNAPGAVVFTGDYIDRGPNSAQILDRLIAGPTVSGWKWICLKGNHEDIMLQARANPAKVGWWLSNGGGQTLLSYGQSAGEMANPRVFVPQAHIDWINALPLTHVDGWRVYVHAGLDHSLPLSKQVEETLIWKLYRAGDSADFHGRHVVHGHHQFEDGPVLYAGRADLDTGAFYSGRLVVGVFDDDTPGGPIDLIENILLTPPRRGFVD